MAPWDARCPTLLIQTLVRTDGKIKPDIIEIRDKLAGILRDCRFICHFVATDGDNAMDSAHLTTFTLYADSDGDLDDIITFFMTTEDEVLPLPVSDPLHLMKNARSRIALGQLAFNGTTSKVITGDSVTQNLLRNNRSKVFQARKPLDLLKDDLAIHAFTIDNLLALWDAGDITGAYFLLPFVSISLAARNPHLSVRTRFGLLRTGFFVLFHSHKHFPKCTASEGISEIGRRDCPRKTLWTKNMCRRASNLCMEIGYAILTAKSTEDLLLAIQRIGSHDCVCHFGTTRSTLRGDTRWTSFFTAQVNAVLIHRAMTDLGLHPYIRRLRSVADCTLLGPDHGTVDVRFEHMLHKIDQIVGFLVGWQSHLARANCESLIQPFRGLARRFAEIGWSEKARKSSPQSGGGIQQRLFTVSYTDPDAPTPEQMEVLEQLGD
jgi:hypothetical protein